MLFIFSLAAALVSPSIMPGFGKVKLKTTARKAAATLNYARNKALRERRNFYAEASSGRLTVYSSAGDAGGRAHVKEMAVPEGIGLTAKQNRVITFYPGGGSSGGVLEFKDSKGGAAYSVKVEPLTGTVRVDGNDGNKGD